MPRGIGQEVNHKVSVELLKSWRDSNRELGTLLGLKSLHDAADDADRIEGLRAKIDTLQARFRKDFGLTSMEIWNQVFLVLADERSVVEQHSPRASSQHAGRESANPELGLEISGP